MSETTPTPDPLDPLLRPHLARSLDGQLGRSREAFAVMSRQRSASLSLPLDPATTRDEARVIRRSWMAGGFGGVIGAAMAAVLMIAILPPAGFDTPVSPDASGPSPARPAVADERPLRHAIRWRTVDDGTVYVNGDSPARSIRQQRLDQLEWFDPRLEARIEVSLPRDEVTLISLPSH